LNTLTARQETLRRSGEAHRKKFRILSTQAEVKHGD
jgi:hypothetical protein